MKNIFKIITSVAAGLLVGGSGASSIGLEQAYTHSYHIDTDEMLTYGKFRIGS